MPRTKDRKNVAYPIPPKTAHSDYGEAGNYRASEY